MEWEKIGQYLERRTPDLMDATAHFAVLVPVVEVGGEPHLLYEVRAQNMRHQPGEICFPGGQMETGEIPLQTALRECSEELGIAPDQVTPLGQLDFLVHRTQYILHPILAQISTQAMGKIRPNPDEVGEYFLVPLSHLMSAPEECYRTTLTPKPQGDNLYEKLGLKGEYHWRAGREDIPVYRWENHIIWGVTGKITRNLLNLLREEGTP